MDRRRGAITSEPQWPVRRFGRMGCTISPTGGLPRLYRAAPVNSIWEGSGSVQCLDVLRGVVRQPERLAALSAELERARGGHPALDAHLDRVRVGQPLSAAG